MKGTDEFYPFAYLLLMADTALLASKREDEGRNHHYLTAVILSAFAVEAAINHIGMDHDSTWAKREREDPLLRGWKKKLKYLAQTFSMPPPDFTNGHAKTVKEAFALRDKFAHGKTWVGEQCDFDDGTGLGDSGFPDWLVQYLNEKRATQVTRDAQKLIEQLLDGAGYPPHTLSCVGSGMHHQTAGPAQPAEWKVKGT